MVAESGCWMAFSIYPDTKMDEPRMVAILRRHGLDRMLVNSGRRLGPQRSTQEPTPPARAMLTAGVSPTTTIVDQLLWRKSGGRFFRARAVDWNLARRRRPFLPATFAGQTRILRGVPFPTAKAAG